MPGFCPQFIPCNFSLTETFAACLKVWPSTHCQDVTGLQPLSFLNWVHKPSSPVCHQHCGPTDKAGCKTTGSQCFVRIVRAGETLFVAVPAVPSIPASLVHSAGEDCDASASPACCRRCHQQMLWNPSHSQQPWVKLTPGCLLHKPQSVGRICAPFMSSWIVESLLHCPQYPQGQL